jgi:hypothetical protein
MTKNTASDHLSDTNNDGKRFTRHFVNFVKGSNFLMRFPLTLTSLLSKLECLSRKNL